MKGGESVEIENLEWRIFGVHYETFSTSSLFSYQTLACVAGVQRGGRGGGKFECEESEENAIVGIPTIALRARI